MTEILRTFYLLMKHSRIYIEINGKIESNKKHVLSNRKHVLRYKK